MVEAAMLTDIKNYIRRKVGYAKYKVGNTYYTAAIRSAYIMDDGRIAVTFLVDHTVSGNIVVTQVQLYNLNGSLWASKAESISRQDAQEGILYRFAFSITET